MKKLLAALLLAISVLALPVHAYTNDEPNEADLTSHDHYTNKSGQSVHSPSKSKSGNAPANASAQCRDGSYSFSKHHSGTCSGHGGVPAWK